MSPLSESPIEFRTPHTAIAPRAYLIHFSHVHLTFRFSRLQVFLMGSYTLGCGFHLVINDPWTDGLSGGLDSRYFQNSMSASDSCVHRDGTDPRRVCPSLNIVNLQVPSSLHVAHNSVSPSSRTMHGHDCYKVLNNKVHGLHHT